MIPIFVACTVGVKCYDVKMHQAKENTSTGKLNDALPSSSSLENA